MQSANAYKLKIGEKRFSAVFYRSPSIRASIDSLSSVQGAVFNAFYICGHCDLQVEVE